MGLAISGLFLTASCQDTQSSQDRQRIFRKAALLADEVFLSFHNVCVYDRVNSQLTCIPSEIALTVAKLNEELARPSAIQRINANNVMSQLGTICFQKSKKKTNCLPFDKTRIQLPGASLAMVGTDLCERASDGIQFVCSKLSLERELNQLGISPSLQSLSGRGGMGGQGGMLSVCGITNNKDLHCGIHDRLGKPVTERFVKGPFAGVDASGYERLCALRESGELLCGSIREGLRSVAQQVKAYIFNSFVCVVDKDDILHCPVDPIGDLDTTLKLPRKGIRSVSEHRGIFCLLTIDGEIEFIDSLSPEQRLKKNRHH